MSVCSFTDAGTSRSEILSQSLPFVFKNKAHRRVPFIGTIGNALGYYPQGSLNLKNRFALVSNKFIWIRPFDADVELVTSCQLVVVRLVAK